MLMALAMIVVGLGGMAGAVYWIKGRSRVAAWPTVPGRVVARAAVVSNRASMSSPTFRWEPTARYVYVVGGRSLEGDRIYLPWAWTSTRARAEAFLARIPDAVDVHYDPVDPAQSTLFPVPLSTALPYAAAGALFVLLGSARLVTAIFGGR